jgi:hypothetical protein
VTTAQVHTRANRARDTRVIRTANARTALRGLTHTTELYVLTFGQFSLLDAVQAILETTGPADVTISTWTAATADLTRAEAFLKDGRIRSLRFLVDRSFLTRQPGYAAQLVRAFGDDAIRTTRTHAKFATIHNPDWAVAVRTSMNMNENPRLEHLEVGHDPDLVRFLTGVVDEIWASEPPGLTGARTTPHLAGSDDPIQGWGSVTGLGSVTL